jgi:hypothetical protein
LKYNQIVQPWIIITYAIECSGYSLENTVGLKLDVRETKVEGWSAIGLKYLDSKPDARDRAVIIEVHR